MEHSIIEQTICSNIQDNNTIFVFPTQTAADLWADRTTLVSDAKAVAMERFTAWDDFKSTSIRSTQQTKNAIPSALRTVFASQVTTENAEKPFLKILISQQFAHQSSGFTSWISDLLPSLDMWKKRFEKSGLSPDDEDEDLLALHKRYTEFLNKNNLFEPAWEMPPFKDDGNTYILFFPEILMDYLEYKPILESAKSIELIHLPQEGEEVSVQKYANTRIEIHQLAAAISQLHEEGVNWNDIAVDVPNLETYAPYIERDFTLHEIPFVRRNGKALSQTLAGSFFTACRDCVQENFSYESIHKLLTNTSLPWSNTNAIQGLIQFGKENNCICSYQTEEEMLDPWEQAFKNPVKPLSDEAIKNLYHSLKKTASAMVNAKSFSSIRKNYFDFRDKFFNMNQCDPASDKIISRCISELRTLIDLENDYPDCTIPSPYSFFTEYLTTKMYVPQETKCGVQILPYRVAACAPFACHCIIDASQKSLSLIYRQLGFLTDTKRESLGITQDIDVSDLYIQLYQINSLHKVLFSVSAKTFDSYALEHSYFSLTQENIIDDVISQEKQAIQNIEKNLPLKKITACTKDSFTAWKETQAKARPTENQNTIDSLIQKIEEHAYKNGKLRISQTTLKDYFTCKRLWLLKNNLKVSEAVDEAQLTDPFAYGRILHEILHQVLLKLKKENLPFKTENGELPHQYEQILQESTDTALKQFEASALAKETLLNKRDGFYNEIKNALTSLCSKLEGYSVLETEKELTYEPEDKNYFFTGTIDCLVRNDTDGELLLIDFKSSEAAVPKNKYAENNDIPDFQMPMYRFLLEHDSNARTVNECVFFCLNKAEVKGIVGTKLISSRSKHFIKDFQETQKRFEQLAEQFANEVTRRPFVLEKVSSDWNTCASCTYKAVCRRTFVVAKKED